VSDGAAAISFKENEMKCPICGGAELIHDTRDVYHSYKGCETIFPDLSDKNTVELSGLRSEVTAMAQDMKVMNAETKAEIVRWVVGVGVLQIGLIAGLVIKPVT
jgi:hypothetical protein